MQSSPPLPLPRRSFLRGLGVALGLPLLEAMHPRLTAAKDATPAPKRFAFIYTPNGYNQATFVPKWGQAESETGITVSPLAGDLPPALQPLVPIRDQINLLTGLDRKFVPGTGVHAQAGACWLTSSPPQETLDGGFPTNITLDQLIAQELGKDTLLPSLELSCNDFQDNKETKYFESISWYEPGYAAGVEKNPRKVFQRLFGQPADSPDKSVLDVIRDDARRLTQRLGRTDREKFDEYLTSIREVERQLERRQAWQARAKGQDVTELEAKFDEPPVNRGDYLRLMGDLIVLAFQNDLARVATLVIDPERWDSPREYHGVFDKPQNHHVLTHTKGDEAKAALTKIDTFHVSFYAYLVSRLARIQEAGRPLLDSCCVAMGSGISDGDVHAYRDLQVLLAGSGQGAVQPGRHLHFSGHRPLADLWLSLARLAGCDRTRFADSTGPLAELHS